MKPKFSISESEWQVLACLWKQSPMEIKDIVTALHPRTGWNANMVRTLVVRLQEKGAVGAEKAADATATIPLPTRKAVRWRKRNPFWIGSLTAVLPK